MHEAVNLQEASLRSGVQSLSPMTPENYFLAFNGRGDRDMRCNKREPARCLWPSAGCPPAGYVPLHPKKIAPELKISGHQSQLIGPETQMPE